MAKSAEEKALEERRTKAKDAVEGPAKQYATLRESLDRSYGITDRQRIAAKRDFFKLYDQEIAEFVDLYHDEFGQQKVKYTKWWRFSDFSEKYEILVRDYLKIFRGQNRFGLNENVSDEERKKNKKNDSARKEADKLSIYNKGIANSLKAGNLQFGASEEADKIDEKVSDGAKKGVKEITKWLYRNCSRRGMAIGDDHSRFVRYFVLTQPLRVKLLGFYMIEKKKEKQPDMLDIMASQIDYEPNLDEFKSAMTATKWKFWARFDGSYIYWDKLSAGMRKAKSYEGTLSNYASLGEVDPPSDSDQVQTAAEEEKQTEQGTKAAPKLNLEKLAKAAQVRKVAFDVFITAAARHRELLESGKGKDKKEVDKSVRNVKEQLNILAEADDEIQKNGGASYKNKTGEFSVEQAGKQTNDASIEKTSDEKLEIGKDAVSYSAQGIGYSGTAVGSAANYGGYVHWNIGEASRGKMLQADGWLNSVAGLTSFVDGCLAIAALTKNASKLTTGEIVQKCFEITTNMATIAQSATASAYKIKNAEDTAAGLVKTAGMQHATKAAGYAGIVTGAFNIAAGTSQVVKSQKQRKDLESGTKGLAAHETNAENRGMANRFAKLADRNHENEEISGSAKAIGGALQLVGGILDASMVAAPIGTILNGIGTVITLGTSIFLFFKKKSDKKTTIDEYIGLTKPLEGTGMNESLLDVILRGCREVLQNSTLTDQQKQEYWLLVIASIDTLKDGIRNEVMGMLGYSGIEDFYRDIIRQYSEFLYIHTFYRDGVVDEDHKVLEKDITDHSCEKEESYAKLLNSIGIEVKYPTNKEEETKVDIGDIFDKMYG